MARSVKNASKTPGRPFEKGNSGRPRGAQNKTTVALKEAILEAAALAGGDATDDHPGGLVGYLKKLADDNPQVMGSLLGRVLPLQVTGDKDNPLRTLTTIQHEIVDPKDPSTPSV